MKQTYGLQGRRGAAATNKPGQSQHTLKAISWILAYAVWIFIFLIPVVGIIFIIVILLKNRLKSNTPAGLNTRRAGTALPGPRT